jgi:hypothetical protein
MCQDDLVQNLSPAALARLDEIMIPIRCLPPFGVHERCEHDPDHPAPTFRALTSPV